MKAHPTKAAVFFAVFLAPLPLYAATYYVAPTGNDTNPGTEAQPFRTMDRGQTAAAAGDTVYFRAGTYLFSSSSAANGVALSKSGTSSNHIKYWAYPGELPIFDFSGMTAMVRQTGIRVTASWIHMKGIEIKNVPQNITTANESWGIHNSGSNNIYEMLNIHHIMGAGLFIARGGNNLVLNSDSHHNYDPNSSAGDGENADGFGCHVDAGETGNVFRGVRAWYNTDDGYDSISCEAACLVEYSWAWLNGYQPDTTTAKGNGNGFKIGGFGNPPSGAPATPPRHTTRFSVAFLNRAAGFYANHHTGASFFYNNTSFNNRSANYNMLGALGVNTSVLRNNIAFMGTAVSNGTGNDAMFNTWNIQVTVSAEDFQSISTTGVDGPRQPDGSLPNIPFMRLAMSSDLIDKGTDVQLPFAGAAPDLGAFEYGAVNPGMGGAAGAGMGGASSGAAGKAGASTGGSPAAGSSGAAVAGSAGSAGMVPSSGATGTGDGGASAGSIGTSGAVGTAGSTVAGSVSTGGSAAGSVGGSTLAGAAGTALGGAVAGTGRAGAAGAPEETGCTCATARRGGASAAWLTSLLFGALAFRARRARKHR